MRLVDSHDGQLSLTNIALIIVIVKLTLIPSPSIFDLGSLLLALANYNAKKLMAPDPIMKRGSNEPT